MDIILKQRIVGTIVLVALAVFFLPAVFTSNVSTSKDGLFSEQFTTNIPPAPVFTIELPGSAHASTIISGGAASDSAALSLSADKSLSPDKSLSADKSLSPDKSLSTHKSPAEVKKPSTIIATPSADSLLSTPVVPVTPTFTKPSETKTSPGVDDAGLSTQTPKQHSAAARIIVSKPIPVEGMSVEEYPVPPASSKSTLAVPTEKIETLVAKTAAKTATKTAANPAPASISSLTGASTLASSPASPLPSPPMATLSLPRSSVPTNASNASPVKPGGDGDTGNTAWVVQVASFNLAANANELQKKLLALGHRSFVETSVTYQGKRYRVKVGPEKEQKIANALKEEIEKQVQLNAIVVNYP